jgi:hypothetical protein
LSGAPKVRLYGTFLSGIQQAISKLITKIGNLGLKIGMQSARQAKLGTVTRKPPKLKQKGLF